MSSSLRSDPKRTESLRWSVYAGVYMYVCGTVVAYLLDDVLSLLADVIGLPATYAMPLLASPALLAGALAWWVLVEHRDSRAYLVGGGYGALTALLTWLFWTVRFVTVWGREMLTAAIVPYLVGLVLTIALVAGGLAGLPMMYARRRLAAEPAR